MVVVEGFALLGEVEGGQDGAEVIFMGDEGEAFLEMALGAAGLDFGYVLVHFW